MSSNPNITPEFVLSHLEKPCDWRWLSKNPNITPEFVLAHPEIPWNWCWMSENKFKHDLSLQKIHLNKLKKFRAKVKSLRIRNWYRLYLLTKDMSQCFWKWYCGPDDENGGGVGRKVDIVRAGCID
ncbi:MAG: hypothetical protein PHG66_00235 [Candidatus Colwellbacteria bacterium]|nr:hypothetical protein [Candidatus Colwellbacteria bacterium]